MKHVWWAVIACGLLVIAICCFAVPLGVSLFQWTDSGPSTVEAIYTAVGALFSGLAFLGVIAAVLFQQQELRLQRDDLTRSVKAEEEAARLIREQMQLTARINATQAALAVIAARHSLHAGSGRATSHAKQLDDESAPLIKRLLDLEAAVAAQTHDSAASKQ